MTNQRSALESYIPGRQKILRPGTIFLVAILGLTGLTACNKKGAATPAPEAPAGSIVKTSATIQAALSAWEAGDRTTAISRFSETDWSVRPLFPSDSTLALTEDQFKALSAADRNSKSA